MTFYEQAMKVRTEKNGILEVLPRVTVKTRDDLSILYTPGVAEPCREIAKNPDASFDLTGRGNTIAVISDGTRVLGLGDIGATAAMPVMEGKALLFKLFGGVNAIPLCIDTKDPEIFINTVKLLAPSFAGINLEDISSPKCYEIETRLKAEMDIPVFHDDQHGTAIVALAGVLGACRLTGRDIRTAHIVMNGAGAAGASISRLLLREGAEHVLVVDKMGILHKDLKGMNPIQAELAARTNPENRQGTLETAVKNADILLGASGPGLFTPDLLRMMNDNAIVFSLANPIPEISYTDAKEAGAAVVGTGRSDAPNQINNVMVFPGIFRGALAVRASAINEEMKLAAAHAIADLVSAEELRDTYVIPDSFDPRVAPTVAAAVAREAMKSGLARKQRDPEDIRQEVACDLQTLHQRLDQQQ